MKTILALCLLLALPAAAQENRAAASSGAGKGGDGAARSGGGGARAGTAAQGGGQRVAPSGGGSTAAGSGASGGSGGRATAGGGHPVTGGSGVAVSRGRDRGADANNRRGESTGSGSPATGGTATSAPTGSSGARALGRDGGRSGARNPDAGSAGVASHARPRDGNEPIVGTAVPRGSVPTAPRGGTTIVTGGLYPWWFGGAGYYGGYYGGYYDPWFGGYPGYDDPQPQVYSGFDDEGMLRLKIKPREAEVYVDGYYVGVVDDFDGVFQKLHIESGAHRIDVRAAGYEPLSFDVRISPDHTTTYRGELKKLQ